MSMFNCPVCGKQNSIRFYHPETFDNDVTIFHKVGRGRGKGFEKILGFSLEEFPELRETLGNRVLRVSAFLNPQPEAATEIAELKRQLEIAEMKRMEAEDELEELDLELLLHKIGSQLGTGHSDIHAAIDELIARNRNLGNANRNMNTVHQNLEASRLRLDQEKRILETEKIQWQNANTGLRDNIGKWEKAYQSLKAQHQMLKAQHQNELSLERNRRIQLEDYLEELDVDVLTNNLHALENERAQVLDFINNELPEEYDLYDDLGTAVSALYQFYEDQVEELSDE